MGKARPMDAEEAQVHKYLSHLGYAKIDYEPDGEVTPDFLVEDRVAVEVRRLNQNYVAGGKSRGLEEETIPLWKRMKSLLVSLGPPTTGESWFVTYTYWRPIEDWRTLKSKVRRALELFKENPYAVDTLDVADRFILDFYPATKPHQTFFVMGSAMDHNAAGFVLGELVTNIRLCIEKKTPKAAGVHSKYPEWWLVLVNRIDNDLSEDDRQQIREHVTVPPIWKKVTVLSWRDHTSAFDL